MATQPATRRVLAGAWFLAFALTGACRDPGTAHGTDAGAAATDVGVDSAGPALSAQSGTASILSAPDAVATIPSGDASGSHADADGSPGADARAKVGDRGACGSPPYVEPPAVAAWQSTPQCRAAARTWATVPHSDRVCATQADCVVVGGNCWQQALNRAASTNVRYQTAPCRSPAAGACAPRSARAVCTGGCCTIEEP